MMVIITQCVNKHLIDLPEIFAMLSREYGAWGYARATGRVTDKFKGERALGNYMDLDREEPNSCRPSEWIPTLACHSLAPKPLSNSSSSSGEWDSGSCFTVVIK